MLFNKIQQKILKEGPITFFEFMKMCLYDPEFGYYTNTYFPIGASGDYITSPHTGHIFGALLSRQLLEFYQILKTDTFFIVEMGAGSGYLALDILSELKKEYLFKKITYIIIEPYPKNIFIQKKNLRDQFDSIRWINSINELDLGVYCFISNELLDAFPVHVVQKESGVFKEIYIDFDHNRGFIECLGKLSSQDLKLYVKLLPNNLADHYRTEINLDIKTWIKDISKKMLKGFLMTIDYGYTSKEYFNPTRNRGTLLAYKDQKVSEELLIRPGEQDLTAHINFSDLSRWGMEMGFYTIGYTPQWAFLGGLDFEEVVYEKIGTKIKPFSPQLAEIKTLIMPQGMGMSHKVMVQAKGLDITQTSLKGFRLKNLINRL
ncbi:MAG: class I SAM-dependent methyltransferase [Dissulfurimicrobium sp.]|uniref:class I SAM-dependent methyltransferase n=1 Tax=Dissulfurimicrobium TaxID=1769732 RepID=UPI001EDC84A0|nr:SAM-dependent methyltransferase [Dissulfurimicrobium hydrothermale]UKL14067.1 SAM-dependent methyltransferase [Dissulfurimicrobium hydrothermale]